LGDSMRHAQPENCVMGDDSPAFLARFQSRLEQEMQTTQRDSATTSAGSFDSKMIANYQYRVGTIGQYASQKDSANDNSFRWKLLAGVASLAAVAAVSWGLIGGRLNLADAPQMAQADNAQPQSVQSLSATPLAEQPQVMIRDPHLDALLAAHKQFGGTTALQMPAGFLRNATFEGPGR
jgi:sigma-E factor negative regulatory protein RseA